MFWYGLLQQFVKKTGSARVPNAFKTEDGFALGGWVNNQRTRKDSLSVERRKLLESSCKDWSWNSLADQWGEAFGQLKKYVSTSGSARVPQHFETKDGFALGHWISRQRQIKDSLSAERRSLLESINGWSWDHRTDEWAEAFGQLKQYVTQNKSARVPVTFTTRDGFALGGWISRQRKNKDSLSTESRSLLESINGWSWDALTDQWAEAFGALKQYVKTNGSARVRATFKTKDGFNLGSWVVTQRTTKDSLSAERRSLLESINGWSWDALTDQWAEAFGALKQYVKTNGSARVRATFKTKDGFALGTWVSTQRYAKDSFSTERRSLLESINGWSWNPFTDRWAEAFGALKQYVKTNGSARVRATFKTKDGFNLGSWVSVQRKNKESMTDERINLLQSCKGWSWDLAADQWNEGFANLQEYAKKTGSARVPGLFKTKDGYKLGSWVSEQRKHKDLLSSEKRKFLESCKGWSWDASKKPTT